MAFYYQCFDERDKSPFGSITRGKSCRIRVRCENESPDAVFLDLHRDDGFVLCLPMTKCQGGYEAVFSLFATGLYFYHFRAVFQNEHRHLYRDTNSDLLRFEGQTWQLSCVPRELQTPSSFYGKIMYQIFPDRFFRHGNALTDGKLTPFSLHESVDEPMRVGGDENGYWNNDFYGGNLSGIEEKLSYLSDLGVEILYLNPIFLAFSNHRYDTADYKQLDPMLGSEKDFKSLCDAAHKKGMRVILDGVFSHVGADSVYFDKRQRFGNGAVSNPDSPYREWFDFQSYPDKYTCWWGIDSLPCVNELAPSFLSYLITDRDSVVNHWLLLGADGFRLDVADELPDEFIQILRKQMKKTKPDSLLIGEVWEDATNKISYGMRRTYFTKCELDSVMNYPFRALIIDYLLGKATSAGFAQGVMHLVEHYPKNVLPCLMNSLSTHDTPRIRSVLSQLGSDRCDQALYLAIALQFFLPGIPCIYYGDEIGMLGEGDPYNRAYFDWSQAGNELHAFVKSLCQLRKRYPALQKGEIDILVNGGILSLIRKDGQTRLTLRVGKEEGEEDEKGLGKRILSLQTPESPYHFTVWSQGH